MKRMRVEEPLEFAVALSQESDFKQDLAGWRKRLENFFSLKPLKGRWEPIMIAPTLSETASLAEDYSPEEFQKLAQTSRKILNDQMIGKTAKIFSPESFTIEK